MKYTHELKVWPEYFWAVKSGAKPFEVRRFDRDFRIGDVIRLRCWLPDFKGGIYDGNEAYRRITYILSGGAFGVEKDFCVLGLEQVLEP